MHGTEAYRLFLIIQWLECNFELHTLLRLNVILPNSATSNYLMDKQTKWSRIKYIGRLMKSHWGLLVADF